MYISRTLTVILSLAAAGAVAGTTRAGEVTTVQFDITEAPLGIFGGQLSVDYLIDVDVMENAQIVGTRFHLEFNTEHSLGSMGDAADLHLLVQPPIENIDHIYTTTGADLGWSGQGTFTADFETDFFNGEPTLELPDGSLGGLLLFRLSTTSGPLGGQFTNSYIEMDFAPIPTPGTLALLGVFAVAGRRRRRG